MTLPTRKCSGLGSVRRVRYHSWSQFGPGLHLQYEKRKSRTGPLPRVARHATIPGRRGHSEPRGERGELFVLRPRRAKGAAEFSNSAHQIGALEVEKQSGTVHEFLIFDSEIAEAAARARMENSFAKKFAVRGMNQRVGSHDLLQPRKRSARSKQQPASREFHSLLCRPGCKLPSAPVTHPPRLSLHPRDKLACLPQQHLFWRVIRLPEFIRERFHLVHCLPRQYDRC